MDQSGTMKERSPRNKTLVLTGEERERYAGRLIRPPADMPRNAEPGRNLAALSGRIINGDLLATLPLLPRAFADLLVIDPPYNLDKDFHGNSFRARSNGEYAQYIASWLPAVLACAKSDASVYICCDWKSSPAIFGELEKHCVIRNRITWQREKGRGAAHNWKNASEDIWFATMGENFYFDVDAVKQRKKVIAPYRENGEPKDWEETADGKFRLTHPSNFWDDITVPYWSMSENTDHPTQKPEKLYAKLILASSKPGDIVFDPFAGSGTAAVTARKLGRNFVCVEQNEEYCLWAEKRLDRARTDPAIQGFADGIFRERNSL